MYDMTNITHQPSSHVGSCLALLTGQLCPTCCASFLVAAQLWPQTGNTADLGLGPKGSCVYTDIRSITCTSDLKMKCDVYLLEFRIALPQQKLKHTLLLSLLKRFSDQTMLVSGTFFLACGFYALKPSDTSLALPASCNSCNTPLPSCFVDCSAKHQNTVQN